MRVITYQNRTLEPKTKINITLVLGALFLFYAVYGYLTGEIFKIPGKYTNNTVLFADGPGVVYLALGYAAFSIAFFTSIIPKKYFWKRKGGKNKRGLSQLLYKPRGSIVFVLVLLGLIMQFVGDVLG